MTFGGKGFDAQFANATPGAGRSRHTIRFAYGGGVRKRIVNLQGEGRLGTLSFAFIASFTYHASR